MSRFLSLWRTSCTCRYTTGDCYPETFFDKIVKEDTACMNFLQYAYSEWSSAAAIAVEKPFRGGRDKKGRRSAIASSTVASSFSKTGHVTLNTGHPTSLTNTSRQSAKSRSHVLTSFFLHSRTGLDIDIDIADSDHTRSIDPASSADSDSLSIASCEFWLVDGLVDSKNRTYHLSLPFQRSRRLISRPTYANDKMSGSSFNGGTMEINLHTLASTSMKLKVPTYDIGMRKPIDHRSVVPKVDDARVHVATPPQSSRLEVQMQLFFIICAHDVLGWHEDTTVGQCKIDWTF